MDYLDHGYLEARSPYDYTFNFWNDYLGLSTLVAKNKIGNSSLSPNSITESLKATLGLDDSPICSCVIGHGGGGGGDGDGGHSDCCCCSCGAPPNSPPMSIFDLKERLSLLKPFEHLSDAAGDAALTDRDTAAYGASFGGLDLLATMDRRRKQSQRSSKPEPKICVFCRNNGAPEEVYGSHILKTVDGRVLCPILRAYTCPLCSANGDNAHTIKYCPLSKEQPSQRVAKGGRAIGKRMKIF